ncbi:phosphomevalonate kinase-like [Symsagittifera roscoffensis]|uniref:phosphomevalonate kinase-like n=1 Tax=Symsagittifera roscoffensis TaxID=84072 RepID=UPI00307C463D
MPKCVLILSGKRKSGKDFLKDELKRLLKDNCCVLTLSAPLKKQYALEHDLDFNRLLDSSDYKELHREEMIKWGEEKRSKQPSFFCELSAKDAETKNQNNDSVIWIVSDARRPTDIEYFITKYGREKIKLIRVTASEAVRTSRGFVFKHGIDDADSECALDELIDWDLEFENNDEDEFRSCMIKLLALLP